jgi:glycerophosphoryl diester phosphodiesterase
VWIIGHRGASGVAPENTLAAFRRAAELGARYVETDLQLSRDAHLVALHDDTLQRTTDGHGPVAAKTLEELRRLDAGSWFRGAGNGEGRYAGERIPTVEEVLAFGREHDIGLFLEIKAPRASGAEHAVVAAVHAASALLSTNVISFDLDVLARVRKIEPVLLLGYLFNKRSPDAVAQAVDAGARTVLPRADRVTPELVEEARRNDIKVVTWTVNDPQRMKALIEMGVDGIMTDFPDRLAALVRGD